jgi:hypothetical protein
VGEAGLEPAKAKPADLQSAPFAARDIPPPTKKPRAKTGRSVSALMVGGRWTVNLKSHEDGVCHAFQPALNGQVRFFATNRPV